MKTNNHYACISNTEVNDLLSENQGEEMVTQFRMEPEILKAYALYFRKFIEGYKDEGIDIYAVQVQNEMNSCQNFPSCIWRPEDLAEFIGWYLGPEFESSGLNTEIWYGTVERPQIERVDSVLLNPETSRFIKGMGFQWAGKELIPKVRKKYPDLKLMQTETECGFGSNDWAAAEYTFNLIKHYLKNGASAYMYWNMVLDETGKSQWGWKQNSMISIDRVSGKITYNPEYYLMKHFSYFVETGSRFVNIPDDENCLAFIKGNDVVIFYFNKEDDKVQKSFSVNEFTIQIVLEPHSFNTFKFRI